MKNVMRTFMLIILLAATACREKDIMLVDTTRASLNILKGKLNESDDSETISFNAYFLGAGAEDHTMKIPVRLSGVPDAENDRTFAVRANPVKTENAVEGEHYTLAAEQRLRKGAVQDSIELTIHIGALGEEDDYKIWLELVPNENFEAGVAEYQYIEIDFIKNINTPPPFWTANSKLNRFTYHPRKCAKFLEVSKITDPEWSDPNITFVVDHWIAVCTQWFLDNDIRDEKNERIYFDE